MGYFLVLVVWHHEGESHGSILHHTEEGHEGVWHHEWEGHEDVWHHEGQGHVKVGAIMVADDHMLAMRSIHGMHKFLNKADADAQRERYIFSK